MGKKEEDKYKSVRLISRIGRRREIDEKIKRKRKIEEVKYIPTKLQG